MAKSSSIDQASLAPIFDKPFAFSNTACELLSPPLGSLQDNIQILMKNKCYHDVATLIAYSLSAQQGIQWLSWCLSAVSPMDEKFADDKTEPDIKSLNSDQPLLWLKAADFWLNQFNDSKDQHLESLSKEAILGAILLTFRQHQPGNSTHQRILEKGISLL